MNRTLRCHVFQDHETKLVLERLLVDPLWVDRAFAVLTGGIRTRSFVGDFVDCNDEVLSGLFPRGLRFFDDVAMSFAEQAYRPARLIDDDGEQARDVTTEDAHVERLELCHGGELSAKLCFRSVLASDSDSRFNSIETDDTIPPRPPIRS